jgi:hypothetical protein
MIISWPLPAARVMMSRYRAAWALADRNSSCARFYAPRDSGVDLELRGMLH